VAIERVLSDSTAPATAPAPGARPAPSWASPRNSPGPPAADQRENRTAQPDHGQRVGIRPALPERGGPPGRPTRLPAHLQITTASTPPSEANRRSAAQLTSQGSTASPSPRPDRQPQARGAAQAHHPPRRSVRHHRGRGPERGRNAAQPAPGQGHLRQRVRRDPPPARLQRPSGAAACWFLPPDSTPRPRPARPARRVQSKLSLAQRTLRPTLRPGRRPGLSTPRSTSPSSLSPGVARRPYTDVEPTGVDPF